MSKYRLKKNLGLTPYKKLHDSAPPPPPAERVFGSGERIFSWGEAIGYEAIAAHDSPPPPPPPPPNSTTTIFVWTLRIIYPIYRRTLSQLLTLLFHFADLTDSMSWLQVLQSSLFASYIAARQRRCHGNEEDHSLKSVSFIAIIRLFLELQELQISNTTSRRSSMIGTTASYLIKPYKMGGLMRCLRPLRAFWIVIRPNNDGHLPIRLDWRELWTLIFQCWSHEIVASCHRSTVLVVIIKGPELNKI